MLKQRIVKVVTPTLRAKPRWHRIAEEEGRRGASGGIKTTITEWATSYELDIQKWAREVGELCERLAKLEKNVELTRGAYENPERELERLADNGLG